MMVADSGQGRLRWATGGGQVRQGERGEMARGGSTTKLKPVDVGEVVREAEKEETIHYKLLGLGENDNAARGEEEGKKKQWHSKDYVEDEARRGNKNEHKEEMIAQHHKTIKRGKWERG
jgi:hypothetical protein